MAYVSLMLNIVILVPVCLWLLSGVPGVDAAYGADTVARRILLCVYGAILILSGALLLLMLIGAQSLTGALVALLSVQILYKLATVAAVGLQNPVVQVNLGVVVIHFVTLATLYWASRV